MDKGKLLVRCHAGCGQQEVVDALKGRGLWMAALHKNELDKIHRYLVKHTTGDVVAVHVRRDVPGKGKLMHWERPNGERGLAGIRTDSLPLYGSELLANVPPGTCVIVTEGEKATEAARRLDVIAVGTVTGATGTPDVEVLKSLIGLRVFLWPDADRAGEQHMRRIAMRLSGLGIETMLLEWSSAPPKGDAADFLDSYGAEAPSQLQELLKTARPVVVESTVVVEAAKDGDWSSLLILNKHGLPKALLANAITALRHAPEFRDVIGFNEFSELIEALQPPPWSDSRKCVWSDDYDRRTADWLQHRGIYVSADVAGQAVQTVAMEQYFHPVRDYLQSLKWDGKVRLESWLTEYLGAEPTEFVRAVGIRWFISGVARIFIPGCKVDHCLVLEGPQGIKKSTALRIIAEPWFTDEIADLGTKDASLQTRGVWVIEMAELDAIGRSGVARIKAFMSRSIDRFRPPYGKRVIQSPRQCFFAATTNQDTYLQDETGGRRFWPVKCGSIKVDQLRQDRDQLWAEAVERFFAGEPWWLDTVELNQIAAEEQAERYEDDPWMPVVCKWLQCPRALNSTLVGDRQPLFTSTTESVTMAEILIHALGKRPDQWTQSDKNRVARCLRAAGWKRYQRRDRRDREWRYKKVTTVTSQQQTFQERDVVESSSEIGIVISATGDSGDIGDNTRPLEILSKME